MLLWLKAMWAIPLVRKAAIYGGIAILLVSVVGLGTYRYGTKQRDIGFKEGKTVGSLALEEPIRAQIEAERQQNKADSERNAQDLKIVQSKQAELERSRAELRTWLQQSLKQNQMVKAANDARVDAIPDSELLPAIREQSAKLAATQ